MSLVPQAGRRSSKTSMSPAPSPTASLVAGGSAASLALSNARAGSGCPVMSRSGAANASASAMPAGHPPISPHTPHTPHIAVAGGGTALFRSSKRSVDSSVAIKVVTTVASANPMAVDTDATETSKDVVAVPHPHAVVSDEAMSGDGDDSTRALTTTSSRNPLAMSPSASLMSPAAAATTVVATGVAVSTAATNEHDDARSDRANSNDSDEHTDPHHPSTVQSLAENGNPVIHHNHAPNAWNGADRGDRASVSFGGPAADRGDRGSQISKHSIGRRTMMRLRRALTDVDMTRLSLPGLRNLWYMGLVVLVLNVVLGIVAAMVLTTSVDAYTYALEYAQLSVDNTQSMFAISAYLYVATLFSSGSFGAAGLTLTNSILARLPIEAQNFADRHQRIFSLIDSSIKPYFNNRDLTVVSYSGTTIASGTLNANTWAAQQVATGYTLSTIPGGALMVGTPTTTSFLDFGTLFTSQLKRLSKVNATLITNTLPDLLTLRINSDAGSTFFVKLFGMLNVADDSTGDNKDALQLVSLGIFLGMGVALLILCSAAILPIIYLIDQSRDSVLENLLEIPPLVLDVLKSLAEKRLKDLRRQGDGDVSESETDEDERAGLIQGGGGGNGSVADETADPDHIDWDGVFAKATGFAAGRSSFNSGNATRTLNPTGRRSFRQTIAATMGVGASASVAPALPTATRRKTARKSWGTYCRLVAFLLPNIAIMGMYAAVYGVTVRSINRMDQMQNLFTAAGTRAALSDGSYLAQTAATNKYGFPAERFAKVSTAWEVLQALQLIHSQIMYNTPKEKLVKYRQEIDYYDFGFTVSGSESNGFPYLSAERNQMVHDIMFGDVCPLLATLNSGNVVYPVPTLAACRAYDNGIFTTGLHFAWQRHMSNVATQLDTTERLVIPQTSANGAGVLYPSPNAAGIDNKFFNVSNVPAGTNTTASSISALVNLATSGFIRTYALSYMKPLFQYVQKIYYDAALEEVQSYRTTIILIIALGVSAISVGIVALFLPAIGFMDRDVHNKRSLVLLLPPQAIHHVRSLKAFVEQMVLGGVEGNGSKNASSRNSGRSGRANSGDHADDGIALGGGDDDSDLGRGRERVSHDLEAGNGTTIPN